MVHIQIINELNAGLVNKDQFAQYICDIVGTEHYNDNLRELRGTFGFEIALFGFIAPTLPPIGTTARAFQTRIADGGALDPNQANIVPLDSCHANFDDGEVDGEELWVLLGMGVDVGFPFITPPNVSPDGDAVDRMNRAVLLTQFSNANDLELGAVADWPSIKGTGTARNGFSNCGSRSFRPIALKPSTKFHVTGRVCSQPALGTAAQANTLILATFTLSYRAWRLNIRETFGNEQCANLFK